MKFTIKLYIIAIISLAMACDKTIQEPTKVAYNPVNLDVNAGNWKTYVLKTPTEIAVAEPAATTSTDYSAEVSSLKSIMASTTKTQKEAVNYWGVGSVLRWNEIARELSAKYNVPPAANAAGIYPVPDRNKPLDEPKFPFANPPYTARALAYLSVAQYDALVATWYYKYKFNRMAPSKIDASITPYLPVSDLPSYPSEDAVVAAASYAILVNMFPGEIPYLDSQLANAKNAGLWAGLNVTSDVVAGEALGKAIGARVLASAADGMANANNQALVEGFRESARVRGITEQWLSQELPARPPMLPNYGAVRTWNFSKADLATIRPQVPYLVNSPEWQKEYDELKVINNKQTREQARIANYWSDGAGSYTPPGHWHRTAANTSFENKESEVRMARTLALMGTALMDAGVACWETKYYYMTPRPQQFGIKTSVGLPNFPSYTSGHSTFSAAAAEVLGYLYPTKSAIFQASAKEASESRIYGLIHFRADCENGLIHGKKIGEYAVARGKADGAQ